MEILKIYALKKSLKFKIFLGWLQAGIISLYLYVDWM